MLPSQLMTPREVFAHRTGAWILDFGLFALAYGAVKAAGSSTNEAMVAATVFAFFYYVACQTITGYTLGKAVAGVRVVKTGTTHAAALWREIVRTGLFLVESGWLFFVIFAIAGENGTGLIVFLIVGTICYIATVRDPQRRRFGDRLAKTTVIEAHPKALIRGASITALLILYLLLLAEIKLPIALALLTIFGPIVIGIAWAVVSMLHRWTDWPWLLGASFSFIPASMMSTVDVCHRTGFNCPSKNVIGDYHSTIIVVILLVLTAIMIALTQHWIAKVIYAVVVVFCEIFMYDKVKISSDLKTARWILVILLVAGVLNELNKLRRRYRASHDQSSEYLAS
jgi:hypothetical protein